MDSNPRDNDNVVPLDLLLKRHEKGVATPDQQRTILQALNAEPTPAGIHDVAPAPGPVGAPPIAYVIHNRSQLCLACNSIARWSETYSLFPAKTHWDKSKVRHLVPVLRLEWNIPIHSQDIAQSTAPFCSECLDATQQYVATLPRPPVAQAILKTITATHAAKPTPRATRGPVTIDDLLS